MTTKFNRFDLPFYEKPADNTPEMMDVLAIGKDCDVFRLKKESLIKKIPVNISDSNNNNLFHLILRDDLKKTQTATINFFKYLLQNNTNPEQPNSDNRTPLHFAAMNQHDKIIEYLLKIGCNPNFKDNFGMTPLHYLMSGKFKVFKNNQVKFIKNYSNKLDIKKNDELQKIQKGLAEHLLKPNGQSGYKEYFDKLNQIIAGLAVDGELAKKLADKIREYGSLALDTSESSSKRLQLIKEARSIIEQKVTGIMNINSIKLNTDIRIKDNEDNVGIEKTLNVSGESIFYYIIDKWDINEEREKIGKELNDTKDDKLKEIIEGLVDNVLRGKLYLYTGEIDDTTVESYFDAIINKNTNSGDNQQDEFVDNIKNHANKDFFNNFHTSMGGFNTYQIENIINIIFRLNNKNFLTSSNEEEDSGTNIENTIKFLTKVVKFILEQRQMGKNDGEIKDLLANNPVYGFSDNVADKFSKLDIYIKSTVNDEFQININKINRDFTDLNNFKKNKDFYMKYFTDDIQNTISTLIKLVNDYSTADKNSNLKSIKDEFEKLTKVLEDNTFLKQTPLINYFNDIISKFNKINLYRLISDFVGFTDNVDRINIQLDSFYNFILPLVNEKLEFKDGEDIEDTDIFYNSNKTTTLFTGSKQYDTNLKIKTEGNEFSETDNTNLKIIKDHQTRVSTLIEYFIKLIIHDFNEAIDNNTNPDKKGLFDEIKTIYEDNINLELSGDYEDLNELNQKKFLIDIIINTVKNILSNKVNNKVVRLTKTSFGGTSPTQTTVLDVVNSSEMRIELAIDLNDIESGITKTDIDKKFIIFSDDYSNLEIEKELLELQISKESFKKMLQSGASIFHPDKNGKYPVDLMVDNKYFCLAEVLARNGMNNVFKKDYLDETIENHFSLFKKEAFYKNQQEDIIELIESNDDYNFKFKDLKKSFEEVNEKSKDKIENSLKNKNKLEVLYIQPIYQNCIKYFTGSKYTDNPFKGELQQLLKAIATKFLKDHIKKFINGNIKAYYRTNSNDVIDLTNFFTAGTFRGMSVNDLLNKLIDDFIKNSCRLFEDEDEESSHDNKRAGELFDNFFDEVATNEFIPMTFDSKLLKILKDNTKNYFEPFIYKLLQNYMVIYENNLKFIINHYRLLKIKELLN